MKGFWCCLFACLSLQSIYGQQHNITLNQTDLTEVIAQFEQQSDFIFNYEPSALAGYSFSGSIDITNPQKEISKVLYDTPLTFESQAQTILIYMAEPQLYRICGTIQDEKNAESLVGANVYADDTNTGSQSDTDGFFDFTISAYKNQKITISYIGYESMSLMVEDLTDQCARYVLSVDSNTWHEVLVKDYKLNGIQQLEGYSGYDLNYNQLSNDHSSSEHDILKTVQLLPGITSLDESASNIQIRGSTMDQNLITWEGATVYNTGHLFGMISAINPFSVHKLEVYKGAYDPKFDNRVGGVVDISLVDTIASSFHGSAGFTLTEAHTNFELPIFQNKVSLVLSARHSVNAFYVSPPLQSYSSKVFQFSKIDDYDSDSENGIVNTEQNVDYYDVNTKLLWKLSDELLFTTSLYKNKQRFSYDFSAPNDPFKTLDRTKVNTSAFSAKLNWRPSSSVMSTISIQHSSYDNLFEYTEEFADTLLRDYVRFNNIIDQSIKLSQEYQLNPNLSLQTGYEYNRKKVNLDFAEFDSQVDLIEDMSIAVGHFHNLYSSASFSRNRWSINGGIRTSYYIEQEKWFNSPRLSLQYALSDKLTVKADGGVFYQFISQLQEFGFNVIDEDNPFWALNAIESQSAQKANKFSSGFIFQNRGWTLDMEAYYNQTSGLFTLSYLYDPYIENTYSVGSSTSFGFDVLIKKRWKKINIWGNYSLGNIDYLFPAFSKRSFSAPNDIRHNLNLVGTYHHQQFQMSFTTAYRTGVPFTIPSGFMKYENSDDEEDENPSYFLEFGDDYNTQ